MNNNGLKTAFKRNIFKIFFQIATFLFLLVSFGFFFLSALFIDLTAAALYVDALPKFVVWAVLSSVILSPFFTIRRIQTQKSFVIKPGFFKKIFLLIALWGIHVLNITGVTIGFIALHNPGDFELYLKSIVLPAFFYLVFAVIVTYLIGGKKEIVLGERENMEGV